LKGRHFGDIEEIWSNTTAALKTIPQNQFQNCFEGAGIGALLPKRSTLKATTVIFSNEVRSIFTAMSSRTLLSRFGGCDYRRGTDGMIGFIDTLLHHSEPHVITALLLIYTLYSSPLNTH
jgi:hypothetical protein